MSTHGQQAALWMTLRDSDVVSGETPRAGEDTPWYLATLVGVSAWIAAGFMFGFFATFFDGIWEEPVLSSAIGIGCCIVALAMMRFARGRDFIEQFAIVTSLVGQLLIGIAFVRWFASGVGSASEHDHWRGVWAGIALVALTMYAVGRLPMHRFLCGMIAAGAIAAICLVDSETEILLAVPLLAWLMLGLWWRSAVHDRVAPSLPPLAWAMSLVLLCVVWFAADARVSPTSNEERYASMALIRDCLIVPLLPACAVWLSSRRPGRAARERLVVVAIASALALLWLRAPGVNIGVTLALIGFAQYRPALLVMGLLGLGMYLLQYYYQLDTTLLQKSAWLIGGGITLLASRWTYLRFTRGEAA